MKSKIFILLCAVLLVSFKAPNQHFDKFIDHILLNFNPPESVKRVCLWQYVILKVNVNNRNKITDYRILNPVANGIDSSFQFLKGYQFDRTAHFKKNNLIICVGIENKRIESCDTVTNDGHPSALMELKKFEKTYKNRDAVFINKNVNALILDRVN